LFGSPAAGSNNTGNVAGSSSIAAAGADSRIAAAAVGSSIAAAVGSSIAAAVGSSIAAAVGIAGIVASDSIAVAHTLAAHTLAAHTLAVDHTPLFRNLAPVKGEIRVPIFLAIHHPHRALESGRVADLGAGQPPFGYSQRLVVPGEPEPADNPLHTGSGLGLGLGVH
jgi:hypothetical protein